MAVNDLKALFEAAQMRWPGVMFEFDRYTRHLGTPVPAHPLDVYVGGAASYRVESAWKAIETQLGTPIRAVLQRQPLADYSAEELWNETMARLLEEEPGLPASPDSGNRPPARIIRYRGMVSLLNYLIVVAKRLAIGRKRKQKNEPVSVTPTEEGTGPTELAPDDHRRPDERAQDNEALVTMRHAISSAYAKLSAPQRFLLTMVHRRRMQQKEAATLIGWSEFKASREMTKAVESMRQALSSLQGVEWTPELRSAWSDCWSDASSESGETAVAERAAV